VLATEIALADGHWSRLWGLLPVAPANFSQGRGLWIVPCRGVHTLGMRYPIDVVYLDKNGVVLHAERNLAPWRFAPVKVQSASVLELPAGLLTETATTVGDTIEVRVERKRK